MISVSSISRFGTAAMLVWLLSSVLIASALHYGRVEATSGGLRDLGFGVCNGQPCFQNITVAATGVDDRKIASLSANLNASPVRINNETLVIFVLDGVDTEVLFNFSGMTITPRREIPALTVAHFIDLYGKPCDMLIDRHGKNLTMLYPKLTLETTLNTGRLSLDSIVRRVKLSAPSQFQTQCMQVRSWIGFTTLPHYAERGAIRVFN